MNTKFEKISEFIDSLENDSTLNDDQAYLLVSGYGAAGSTKVNNGCKNDGDCRGTVNNGCTNSQLC
ncbi:MAG TPA: hypothetical protein DIT04_10970 [Dysgonomonas sp.]|nr:hypothetical protein [Dysgonomonas sp.]